MSTTINASDFRSWEAYGLADFGDFADCVEFINQTENWDGTLNGAWYYVPEEPIPFSVPAGLNCRVIYGGTFSDSHSPGASHYTFAEVYDMSDEDEAAEYAKRCAELLACEEYDPDDAQEWEVICGNVGTVYDGTDEDEARRKFAVYVEQSKSGRGRAGNEDVTLLCNGEIVEEHSGTHAEVDD